MRQQTKDLNEGVGQFLQKRALLPSGQALIFYGVIASEFGLPPHDGAWLSHPLCKIFGVLDLEDHELNRPFRTALVVNREKMIPGDGFFETAQRLGRYKDELKDDINKAIFWAREYEALLEYWKRKIALR